MIKKVFIIVFVLTLFLSSSCLAFDGNEIVFNILNWTNDNLKPFLEEKLGEASKIEFEREVNETIKDFPHFISSIWNNLKELLK